jgi:predicted hotdog family 3-hydroxylacyl-ACP dehydratase
MTDDDFPPIEELLPHRGIMLLLDRVLSFDAQTVAVEYTPRATGWYADTEGNMPGWIGLELMAQAVATHVALTKRRAHSPMRIGVLLGTRRYACEVGAFTASSALQIHAHNEFQDQSGLGAYQCSIHCRQQKLASALLKVYEPQKPEEFLRIEDQH